MESTLFVLFGLLVFLPLYLCPTIIAFIRKTENRKKLRFWNILIGWFPLAWPVLLIFSFISKPEPPAEPQA